MNIKPKSEGDFTLAQTHYKKQMPSRLRYLNNLKEDQWRLLYAVLVPEVFCPYPVRVGGVYDGGKYVCNPARMPRTNCSIYSLGIGGDMSFDEELQTFNNNSCRIYGYDQSIQAEWLRLRYEKINGKLKKVYISPISQQEQDRYTIGDLVRSNNDTSVEFLKMDVEGAEHKTLIPFLEEYRVCQIFLELHGSTSNHTQLLRKVATLDYALFSYEPNAYCSFCCEYSFIHLSCMERYGVSMSTLYLKNISTI